MLRLIVGSKGSGKTKKLLNLVNEAAESTKGNVVCIEKGEALKFDLTRNIRLVDIEEYGIAGEGEYFGFLAGLLAGNYDITELFCDATYRILCGDECKDAAVLEAFLLRVKDLAAEHETEVTFTISADLSDIPEALTPYVVS